MILMNTNSKRKLNIGTILYVAGMTVASIAIAILLFYASIMPSVALEQQLRCGIEEHAHVDSCYNGDFLECKKPAHSHDGNCYIVLLHDNDINTILSLLDKYSKRSLENVIQDVVSTALVFNDNLNTTETMSLTSKEVAELNTTIADADGLPNIVLNENINNISTMATEQPDKNINTVVEEIDAQVNTSNNKANFFVYLDGAWTCIGTLDFTTVKNGNRYDSTLQTSDVLDLVNGSLGTDFTYESFDIATSRSQNSNYTKDNVGMGVSVTTIEYKQYNFWASSAKYVRLIPNNESATSTNFAFHTVRFSYPDGSTSLRYVQRNTSITLPSGNYEWTSGNNTYDAGEVVTITKATTFTATHVGPVTHVNVHYNMNFPTVSGVTVSTKPTLAGFTVGNVTDGYSEGSSAVIRNVSQQMVVGKMTGNSTGLSRVIQFKGWKINGTDEIIQPNTSLVWEELLKYEDETSITLTGVWEYDAVRTASFFIRFDSVAVDTGGNITGQDQNKYTNELFASYVGGVDTSWSVNELQEKYHIVDTTSDNSYGADQQIRALYGEKTEGVWLSAFPSDDFIFSSLVDYAKTGYLSVEGVPVKVEDLNHNAYAIRWYVFKCQSDAWHIDGKLVRKEGLIHVYKNFAGNKELVARAKEGFYVDAYNHNDNVHTTLNMSNYISYNEDKEQYMWEIDGVDYGETWTMTEYPNKLDGLGVEFSIYSEYNIMDIQGGQSIAGVGTSATVTGQTYALDKGIDEVLRVEFNNIYNRKDSILIKKQDSRTGMSISGATFQMLQNGKILKFSYDSQKGSYIYNQTGGTHTTLNGDSNGYFEISIEDFSYDLGPVVVRETRPPTGYTPIGDIEIGYVDSQNTVGILSGNSELIQYTNGILIVGNSTDSVSVTAKKTWDCPEREWQDVTVQLLANDKLVTTVIAGVEPQVVLNADNNWSYTWDNLPVYVNGSKIAWSLKEIQIGEEACKTDGSFVNWLVSYELPVHSTGSDGKEDILLVVTNTTKRVMLRLTKTDLGKTKQLAGATFLLEVVDANGNVIETEVSKTATTGDAGTLIFDNMKCGVRYRLSEIETPEGYLPLEEYIYFTIEESGAVVVEPNYFAEAGNTAYNIIVRNAEAIPMPESGGTGTSMLYAIGALLMIAVAGIYINNKKMKKEY